MKVMGKSGQTSFSAAGILFSDSLLDSHASPSSPPSQGVSYRSIDWPLMTSSFLLVTALCIPIRFN